MAESAQSLRRAMVWGVLCATALAVAVTMLMASRWAAPRVGEPPPVLFPLPAFSLMASDGSAISKESLAGSPWVADFIFTRCALSCPRLTARMKQLGPQIPAASGVRRVSISVDPANDSPEVLTNYADAQGITDPDWLFLTGDREAIRELSIEGFKLGLDDAPPAAAVREEEPILHSNRFVLVDGQGRIRGYYDATLGAEINSLVEDLEAVVAEEAAARQAATP